MLSANHKRIDEGNKPDDRHIPKDETVILYRYVWAHIFLVGDGKVEALKESETGAACMRSVSKGELFWGLAFFTKTSPCLSRWKRVKRSVLYLWILGFCSPIFLRNGQVSWEISRLMEDWMQHASNLVEGLAFHLVAGRLARLLLDNFETAGDSSIPRVT